ncbi:type I DNA topoisomerase, partial [bacterium]|nr:type I DNA topoisomerase [bacterium]
MAKNLIIVESPAKARTISKFLGEDYFVTASMGHVRDLPSSVLGFDPENDFAPQYEIPKDKKKTVAELKKQINSKTEVYLATDEDREGEAISWHLLEALGLEKRPVKRIVFHEITKSAILNALEKPREVDQQLVDAQQARRILDRAVGYELSPLLWKKIKPGLSAGRVQSVSVHILVEREKEIRKFEPEEYWKIRAEFAEFTAELKKLDGKPAKVVNETEAKSIEDSLKQGNFSVSVIDERMAKRNPGAPFTTSTIQQEASVKLGFSLKRTMVVAQQLYEGNFNIPDYSGGLITYMRTDSVVLANQALMQAQEVIGSEYGSKFGLKQPRFFKNRSTNAQEAHEAIRPVDFSLKPSAVKESLSSDQFRLYSLVWKRALASQMSAAEIARTTLKIEAGVKRECLFEAQGQRVVFPGFLLAYSEGKNDVDEAVSEKDVILPKVEKGQILPLKKLNLEQLFTKPPPRYTEASLVKKMESEGIGRPSTYAPTISTIQDRGYVEVTPEKRLKPTSIGEVVTDFLTNHFPEIVNLGFTAKIERNFDRIANGEENWVEMIANFYQPFHQRVGEKDESVTRAEVLKRRELGTDPESGKPVSVSIGKFGPMVQIGTREDEEKPRFASLPSNLNLNEVTFEEAMECFALPLTLGTHESG